MSIHEKYQRAINEAVSLRDTARVQAHLFSLDARKRWGEIEDALRNAERAAGQDGTPVTDAVVSAIEHAGKEAREFLRRHVNGVPELDAPVQTIMTDQPAICRPGDCAVAAATIMWERNCGAVPIVGKGNVLLGIVTDRDLAMSAYLRSQPLSQIRLDTVMSKSVCTLGPTSTVGDALLCMGENRIRRVLITDEEGHLQGIVALADVARYVESLPGAERACRVLGSTLASISARPSTPAS